MDIPQFSNPTEADRYYLAEAERVRAESDDPKAVVSRGSSVGAVIADRYGEISRSANVLPPRLKAAFVAEARAVAEADRYFVIEHAERAALFQAWQTGRDLSEATLYCTRSPCSDCARAIVAAGIQRVVLSAGFTGEVRWLENQRAALRMMRDAGTKIRYFARVIAEN